MRKWFRERIGVSESSSVTVVGGELILNNQDSEGRKEDEKTHHFEIESTMKWQNLKIGTGRFEKWMAARLDDRYYWIGEKECKKQKES